jgi:hypothetical protein
MKRAFRLQALLFLNYDLGLLRLLSAFGSLVFIDHSIHIQHEHDEITLNISKKGTLKLWPVGEHER